MSDPQAGGYLVRNHRDQPVELYVGGTVLIVPPRAALEVDASALASPQLQALQRQRLVSVAPVVAADPAAPSGAAEPGEEKPAASGRRKRSENEEPS